MTQYGVGLVVRGTAPAGSYPSIDSDEIDRAAARTEGLIGFARAKKVLDANANFTDRLLVPITKYGAGSIRTAADGAFNGKPTININGNDREPYRMSSLLATPSFTFIAAIRKLADDGAGNFFGSSAGFVSYFSANACTLQPNWNNRVTNPNLNASITPTLNETAVWWVSFDNASKTIRLGKNTSTPLIEAVHGNAHAVDGVTHKFQPFGFISASTPSAGTGFLHCKWATWAIFDRAYGSGGNADANFADLIEAAKSHYGIA